MIHGLLNEEWMSRRSRLKSRVGEVGDARTSWGQSALRCRVDWCPVGSGEWYRVSGGLHAFHGQRSAERLKGGMCLYSVCICVVISISPYMCGTVNQVCETVITERYCYQCHCCQPPPTINSGYSAFGIYLVFYVLLI